MPATGGPDRSGPTTGTASFGIGADATKTAALASEGAVPVCDVCNACDDCADCDICEVSGICELDEDMLGSCRVKGQGSRSSSQVPGTGLVYR